MITRARPISPKSGTTSDLIDSMQTVGFPATKQRSLPKPTIRLGYLLRPEYRGIYHVVFHKGSLSSVQLIRRSNAICIVKLLVQYKPPGTTRSEDELSTSIQVMNGNTSSNKQNKRESDYSGRERGLSGSVFAKAIHPAPCN